MPGLDQQLNPAFSPDGGTVVFRGQRGGKADLYAYEIATKNLVNLTDDDAFDFAPAYSPDGRWIYYSSIRGTKAKIFRLDPASSDTREQITYGDWNDEDPTLSPDGKRLFLTSDRDGGIYNIYSINLETGEVLLHTNVVGGAFSPTVFVGKDNAEKLVFTAYYKRRFTLYIADTKKPVRRLPDLSPAASPVSPGGIAPFEPAIQVAVDPEKIREKPSRKLQLEDAQVVAGVNTDQTFVSNTVLIFGDNLGDRRFIAVLQSVSSFTNIDFAYYDLTRRLQKGIRLFDDRQYFLSFDQSRPVDQIQRDRRVYRITGGPPPGQLSAVALLPRRGRARIRLPLHRFPVRRPQPGRHPELPRPAAQRLLPEITFSLVGDNVLYQEWGPLSGARFRISANYAPDFQKNRTPVTGGRRGRP